MGRLEPSVGRPPAGFRKAARAKRARATVNVVIPGLLSAYPRARRGIEATELIDAPGRTAPVPGADADAGPRLRLQVADTLTAARRLQRTTRPDGTAGWDGANRARVAILNMASPLSPGGGFLNGAGSQEESLCMRMTLLPSLQDAFYRLPERGVVYTPDVLVFRGADGADLAKRDRWFVDCASAAMLRLPAVSGPATGPGGYAYDCDADRALARDKMRAVLRVCAARGVRRLVLGAWGCGAYGNPVGEVAAAWRHVLVGGRRDHRGDAGPARETWPGIEEVVFAIREPGLARAFAQAFAQAPGDGLELVEDSGGEEDAGGDDEDGDEDEDAAGALQSKVRELEARIEATPNPQVKATLGIVLAGLQRQLGRT